MGFKLLCAISAFLALIALLLLTPFCYVILRHIEQRVNSNSQNELSELQSELYHSTKLLHPLNSSSTNIARLLGSSTFNKTTNVSFFDIETKVAPVLFQALQTIPHLTEISYIGIEGLFLSYYMDHNRTLALYSNSSLTSKAVYYVQPINPSTGGLYGEPRIYEHHINASRIQEEVNSASHRYSSLGSTWSNDHQVLYVDSVRISRTAGVISLGFSATSIIDFVTPTRLQGASLLYLASKQDGKVILQGSQRANVVFSNDTASFYLLKSNGNQMSYQGSVSCKDNEASAFCVLKIGATRYLIRCSSIDVMGVESVYVLAVPQNGLVVFVHKSRKLGLLLMSSMIVTILISISSFALLNAIMGWREIHLCASLIKQMEATQQAERKSMNKSVAFSRASHDIRASLAGIIGLVEMSCEEVVPDSELETNLKQMGACIKDLQGLLNSVLDTSKIEAGKMQLEEQEFDLSQFIEDKVDLFHPVAMKKGVDLVLDHCDGSVIRYSPVKGDKGKLQQVLCNLLSNAVKFTDKGHIVVRAWAKKPSFKSSRISTHRYSFMKLLSSSSFCKKNEADIDVEAMNNTIQQDPNYLEFVFEVDDTGKGIPKEKQASVFENYVQVKETALGLEGTGLGLGIVQSLVHLMHGNIEIVDKEIGEKGTCFRFSILLSVSETAAREVNDLNQHPGQDINKPSSGSSNCSPSPRLPIFATNRLADSHVVLLIQNEGRRRITRRFMERLGIKVKEVKRWEHFSHILKKIKQKQGSSSQSSTGTSYMSSDQSTPQAHSSNTRAKGFPLSAADGSEYVSSVFSKLEDGVSMGLVLLVIDASAAPFEELGMIISDFRRGLRNPCQVVWLNKPLARNVNEDVIDPNDDIVLSKPLHGTRLFNIIRLLPEFGGGIGRAGRNSFHNTMRRTLKKSYAPSFQDVELQDCDDSSWRMEQLQDSRGRSKTRNISQVDHHGERQECSASSSSEKPLSGKRFLVVDDTEYLRMIALKTLKQLGATSMECNNGEDAVNLIEEALTTGASPNPPYDYIIMDCEMPVMDGFEATMKIRKMEKSYGVYIPIMALTAHTSEEETNKIKEVGMDAHLSKPLKKEHLLDAIRYIDTKLCNM